MSTQTSIEWTEQTWNPTVGCTNVAFFFKRWGGWGADGKKRAKKENGRLLLGRTWDEIPHTDQHAQLAF